MKWGLFRSHEKSNPDILEFKVLDTKTFETEYSTNVKIYLKSNNGWNEVVLPLKSHESTNSSLLKQWTELVAKKKIILGSEVMIKTWLGISKHNRVIRKFKVEV